MYIKNSVLRCCETCASFGADTPIKSVKLYMNCLSFFCLQSPGRDSPGSSGSGSGSGSRHSTASLDSGRASGSHFHGPRAPCSTLSSSPRCSISSSSIVSSENGPPGARVERLMHQGVPVRLSNFTNNPPTHHLAFAHEWLGGHQACVTVVVIRRRDRPRRPRKLNSDRLIGLCI